MSWSRTGWSSRCGNGNCRMLSSTVTAAQPGSRRDNEPHPDAAYNCGAVRYEVMEPLVRASVYADDA